MARVGTSLAFEQRLIIDRPAGTVIAEGEDGSTRTYPLGSPEAFELISRAFLRAGWDTKYVYGFSWLGRPIIQFPEDMLRLQEVIFSERPDVILETGVAHGGSLVFYASLCKAMDAGRVIGVDIEIRPDNRRAIEAHFLYPLITLIEGDSVSAETVAAVKRLINPGEKVLVVLDSAHDKEHVLAELRAYGELVSPGSYIVAADGIMETLVGAPRSAPDWGWNNPAAAAREFTATSPGFAIDEPEFPFNEGAVSKRVTYWPDGFVKRLR